MNRTSWFKRKPRPHSTLCQSASRPHTFQPRLEKLEDRLSPATFTVTNIGDSSIAGSGSLRDAITQANTAGGTNIIQFTGAGASGIISVLVADGALPAITNNLTIQGPGAAQLNVQAQAGNNFSVFTVKSGVIATIAGLTISGGQAPSGGGIFNRGTLTVQNCTISGNTALGSGNSYGGAIYNKYYLYMSNSTLMNNKAQASGGFSATGGAIYNKYHAYLSNCTLSGNMAQGGGGSFGGAIGEASGALLHVGYCNLTNNTAAGGQDAYGGAIWSGGTTYLTSSTLTGNTAAGATTAAATGFKGKGGAIYNKRYLRTANCTFSGNLALGGASTNVAGTGGKSYGGAIANYGSGKLNLTASTFTSNSAQGGSGFSGGLAEGGAVFNNHQASIASSTLSGNSATGGAVTFAGGKGGSGLGGAIYSNTNFLAVVSSTLSSNTAAGGSGAGLAGTTGGAGRGGGIYCYYNSPTHGTGPDASRPVYLLNSTLAFNTAAGGAGTGANGAGSGGAIYDSASKGVVLTNSTVAMNTANPGPGTGSAGVGTGGGISVDSGTLKLQNTIVSGNTAASTPNDLNRPAGTISAYYSLIQTPTAAINGSSKGNLTGQSPNLGPLQLNGGPTQTMDLLPGSPAIDRGNNSYITGSQLLVPSGVYIATGPFLDQNNNNRIVQGSAAVTPATVDIGAAEYLPGGINIPTVLPNSLSNSPAFVGVQSFYTPQTSNSPVLLYYGAQQVQAAYNLNQIPLPAGQLAGQGQTIVIYEPLTLPTFVATSDPNYQYSDMAIFDRTFGLPDPPSLQIVGFDATLNGGAGGAVNPSQDAKIYTDPGSSGEFSLDVEWAHVMAPGANIIILEANGANGNANYFAALAFAATLPGVSTISTSYDSNESSTPSESQYDYIFQNGPSVTNTFDPVTGQTTTTPGHNPVTYFFASGDMRYKNGAVEYPPSSPYVVAVGATALYLNSSTVSGSIYNHETAWYSTQGGPSQFGEPNLYQQQAVQNANKYTPAGYSSLPTGARITPDVSIVGSSLTTGATLNSFTELDTIGTTYSKDPWNGENGTSIATPKIAALVAIVDQLRANAGLPTLSGPQVLKQLYSLPATDFNPISGIEPGATSNYTAYPEPSGHIYNTYTGLGSPIANLWVPDMAGIGMTVSGPISTTAGASIAVTVTVEDLINSGMIATGYRGTVHFSSSDVLAGLPANYTFTAADQGTHTFYVTLQSLGNQSITVTDTTAPFITGSLGTSVGQVPTALSLSSSLATAQVGLPVTFSASVTNLVATAVGSPTGSVTFTVDGQAQATAPLVNGVAQFTTASLGAGRHIISATYGGTATFLASSATLTQILNQSFLAVGADAGGDPQVTVYNPTTGALVASFYAFAPSFAGGVRVAVDDLNGDGTADIICAAGPSTAPQVEVIDGTKLTRLQSNGEIDSSALIASFYAFSPTFNGGVYVAAGTSSSGQNWIAVGAGGGGGPQVEVFTAQAILAGAVAGTAPTPLTSFYAFNATFAGGVTVALGDVNGDGKLDVIAGAGPGGGPQVIVVDGTKFSTIPGTGILPSGTLLASFFAFNPGFKGGVFVSGGVTPGSPFTLIVGAGPSNGLTDVKTAASDIGVGPQVLLINGALLAQLQGNGQIASSAVLDTITAFSIAFAGGVRVGFSASYGSSGKPTILTGAGPTGGPQVAPFDGASFSSLANYFALPQSFTGGLFLAG